MARPPNYQLYPLVQGARCGNCKNLEELHEGYACAKFGARVKEEAVCDDWEREPQPTRRASSRPAS